MHQVKETIQLPSLQQMRLIHQNVDSAPALWNSELLRPWIKATQHGKVTMAVVMLAKLEMLTGPLICNCISYIVSSK